MNNVRTIYLDWCNGSIRATGGLQLAYQYDHLSNLVIFENAPKLDNYYLIVEMKETEDGEVRIFEPIQLAGSFWLIPNSYTQLAQNISFQVCCKTEIGDFERHSAQFTGTILPSKDHTGAELDVDPSIMFDPYKQWVSDIAMAAGAIVIDPTLSIQGAAADAKAVGDVVTGLNGRLTQVEASQKIKASEELKTILQNMMTLFSDVAMYKGDVDIPAIAEETNDLIDIIDIVSLTLTGIDVVFAQGGNVIYSNASLEDLKQYLTVTAHYDDGSTRQTTGYELGGTIATGTQTFTVTLGEFSDTFDAVITKAVIDYTQFITYQLPEETTFDGTNRINTGVKLGATDEDFTIMFKGSLLTENWGKMIFGYYAYSTATGAKTLSVSTRTQAGGKKFAFAHNNVNSMTDAIASSKLATPNEFAVAIIHSANDATTRYVIYFNDWKCIDSTPSVTYRQETSASLFIGDDRSTTGSSPFIGTIHDFTLYSTIVDDETITEYLEG